MKRLAHWLGQPSTPLWVLLLYSALVLLALYASPGAPGASYRPPPLPATASEWMRTNPHVVCEIPSWVCTDNGPVGPAWHRPPLVFFPPFEGRYD